jgi:hypothetical protein
MFSTEPHGEERGDMENGKSATAVALKAAGKVFDTERAIRQTSREHSQREWDDGQRACGGIF